MSRLICMGRGLGVLRSLTRMTLMTRSCVPGEKHKPLRSWKARNYCLFVNDLFCKCDFYRQTSQNVTVSQEASVSIFLRGFLITVSRPDSEGKGLLKGRISMLFSLPVWMWLRAPSARSGDVVTVSGKMTDSPACGLIMVNKTAVVKSNLSSVVKFLVFFAKQHQYSIIVREESWDAKNAQVGKWKMPIFYVSLLLK